MTNAQRKWLANICGNDVNFDVSMSEHTSFRVGGPADAYAAPEHPDTLIALIKGCYEQGIRYFIFGDGTNILVKDSGIRGIVIALTKFLNKFTQTYIQKDEIVIKAMAGVKMQKLCAFAIKHGLEGMNLALGIPGTVGGGIAMNAGTASGAMENVLTSVNILLPTGQIKRIKKKELKFEYRKLNIMDSIKAFGLAESVCYQSCYAPVILEGEFCLHQSDPVKLKKEAEEILKTRKEKQPSGFPSAGCFFKNPSCGAAGQLIEQAGLKGKRIGGAEVSVKHANFIINRGKASASDILTLAECIQETVFKKFNIMLEPEVKIVG